MTKVKLVFLIPTNNFITWKYMLICDISNRFNSSIHFYNWMGHYDYMWACKYHSTVSVIRSVNIESTGPKNTRLLPPAGALYVVNSCPHSGCLICVFSTGRCISYIGPMALLSWPWSQALLEMPPVDWTSRDAYCLVISQTLGGLWCASCPRHCSLLEMLNAT